MQIFVTGTDTDVGKTLICTWLCLHSGYDYFKPVQTGSIDGTDSLTVAKFCDVKIHPESFVYKEPLSPHRAAALENETIDIDRIVLPDAENLIIEGAGGLMVPINDKFMMIDLIKKFEVPVLLVARSGLGTINHTLLSIEALRARDIPLLGMVMNGPINDANREAIEFYGKTKVLACVPKLDKINRETLSTVTLPEKLQKILQ
jgi:dethiobiotin synthetase